MKNTVKALEAIADTRDIFVEEEITGYDVDKMKDLMPDFRMKILFLQNWFAGNIETTYSDEPDEEPSTDVVVKKKGKKSEKKDKTSEKREYKLMPKATVKKIAEIVAEECKGLTTKEAVDHILKKNKRYRKDGLQRIVAQKSFGNITSKYFVNENGIIV